MIDIRSKYSIAQFEKKVFDTIAMTKKESPTIVIQGGYGKNNLGDDALLHVIYTKIKSKYPASKITALCHYPNNIKHMYGIRAVGYKSFEVLPTILSCDVLIIGGGGIVNVVNTFSGLRYLRIFDPKGKFLFLTSLITKLRKKKVIFYGVGLESIPDCIVKMLIKFTLPKVDLIGVRDEESAKLINYITKVSPFITHDPAIDFDIHDIPKWDSIKRYYHLKDTYTVVSVRAVPNEDINSSMVTEIVKCIDVICQQFPDEQIVILPASCHPQKAVEDDRIIEREIYLKTNKKDNIVLIEKYLQPNYIKKLLSFSDFIFMARLHGLILSYEYNIPTAVLSYNSKVTRFAEMCEYSNIYHYESLQSLELIDYYVSLKKNT